MKPSTKENKTIVTKGQLLKHVAVVVSEYLKDRGIHNSQVRVDSWLLNCVIDSSMQDLARMADFHIPPDSSPDRHKYAGYVAKWIAKILPMQLLYDLPLTLNNKNIIWLNSELALYVFTSFLNGAKLTPGLVDAMRYSFTYREQNATDLAVLAYCCEKINP